MTARPRRSPSEGPSYLLVDLDDTLFDHVGSSDRALRRLRARHAALRRWSSEELLRRHTEHLETIHTLVLQRHLTIDEARAERMRRLFQEAGEVLSEADAIRRARHLRREYQAVRRAVPGAGAFLRYVHRRAAIAVVTNNLLKEQREKLAFLGLAESVDELVTSEEEGVAKPDPRLFQIAMDRLGADPDRVVMLGDSYPSDVRGGRAAGLPVVWFNRFSARPPPRERPAPQLRSLRPPATAWAVLVRAWRRRPGGAVRPG